jgi:hypothetical protein
VTSPQLQAAQARWTAFLDKIEGRMNELLGGAEQALPDLVDMSDFELTPYANAMTGVRTQCLELIHKIETTWNAQVSATLEQALGDGPGAGKQVDRERERGEALARRLEHALRKAEVQIAAVVAERIVAQARKILSKDFKCSHCGAPLTVRECFFRSYYVNCQWCKTVNTFEPGLVARQVEHFSVHALAEKVALEANLRYLEAEDAYRRSRGAAADALKVKLVEIYSNYVDTYLGERIRWLPDLKKDVEKDRRARIDSFIGSIA